MNILTAFIVRLLSLAGIIKREAVAPKPAEASKAPGTPARVQDIQQKILVRRIVQGEMPLDLPEARAKPPKEKRDMPPGWDVRASVQVLQDANHQPLLINVMGEPKEFNWLTHTIWGAFVADEREARLVKKYSPPLSPDKLKADPHSEMQMELNARHREQERSRSATIMEQDGVCYGPDPYWGAKRRDSTYAVNGIWPDEGIIPYAEERASIEKTA